MPLLNTHTQFILWPTYKYSGWIFTFQMVAVNIGGICLLFVVINLRLLGASLLQLSFFEKLNAIIISYDNLFANCTINYNKKTTVREIIRPLLLILVCDWLELEAAITFLLLPYSWFEIMFSATSPYLLKLVLVRKESCHAT